MSSPTILPETKLLFLTSNYNENSVTFCENKREYLYPLGEDLQLFLVFAIASLYLFIMFVWAALPPFTGCSILRVNASLYFKIWNMPKDISYSFNKPTGECGGEVVRTSAWEFFNRCCTHIGEDICPVVCLSGHWQDQPPAHCNYKLQTNPQRIKQRDMESEQRDRSRQRGVERQRKVYISASALTEDGTWSKRVCDWLKLQRKIYHVLPKEAEGGAWGSQKQLRKRRLEERHPEFCVWTLHKAGFEYSWLSAGYTENREAQLAIPEHPGVLMEELGIPESTPQRSQGQHNWDLHCHPPQADRACHFNWIKSAAC